MRGKKKGTLWRRIKWTIGEEADLIVITKNYVLGVYGLLSKMKKNRFATVSVNILYCFLTRLWLEQKNNKCFKVDWRNPGKIEDSKKNEIVWILCVQSLLRTFKFKARDLLSWRLPNKEPLFELFASRHYSLIEVAKWKFVMIYWYIPCM